MSDLQMSNKILEALKEGNLKALQMAGFTGTFGGVVA